VEDFVGTFFTHQAASVLVLGMHTGISLFPKKALFNGQPTALMHWRQQMQMCTVSNDKPQPWVLVWLNVF